MDYYYFFFKVKTKNLYRTQHNMEKLRQIFSWTTETIKSEKMNTINFKMRDQQQTIKLPTLQA